MGYDSSTEYHCLETAKRKAKSKRVNSEVTAFGYDSEVINTTSALRLSEERLDMACVERDQSRAGVAGEDVLAGELISFYSGTTST